MKRLSKRERQLAITLTAVVGAWSVYAFAVQPMQTRIRTLERVLPEKYKELQELRTESAEYGRLHSGFAGLQARMTSQDPDFELLPFLESLIEQQALTTHVVTMQQDTTQSRPDYTETVVEIELNDISLRQLIELLGTIRSSSAVAQVGSLHIRKDPKSKTLLDSTIEIRSPQVSQSAVAADLTGLQSPP